MLIFSSNQTPHLLITQPKKLPTDILQELNPRPSDHPAHKPAYWYPPGSEIYTLWSHSPLTCWLTSSLVTSVDVMSSLWICSLSCVSNLSLWLCISFTFSISFLISPITSSSSLAGNENNYLKKKNSIKTNYFDFFLARLSSKLQSDVSM